MCEGTRFWICNVAFPENRAHFAKVEVYSRGISHFLHLGHLKVFESHFRLDSRYQRATSKLGMFTAILVCCCCILWLSWHLASIFHYHSDLWTAIWKRKSLEMAVINIRWIVSGYFCHISYPCEYHFSLKDKSGVDEIIVTKQPCQLLNTNREFFPSFDASNFHNLVH